MSDRFIYALMNSGLPSLSDWQRAIDKWDLLIPVKLKVISIDDELSSSLNIDGHEVHFICAKMDPEWLSIERSLDIRARWSSAYGFRGLDQHRQFYAAAVACISCVLATRGAFLGFGHPLTHDPSKFRRDMDMLLTATLNRDEVFYSRYPEERPVEPSGPAALIITTD